MVETRSIEEVKSEEFKWRENFFACLIQLQSVLCFIFFKQIGDFVVFLVNFFIFFGLYLLLNQKIFKKVVIFIFLRCFTA